MNKLIKYTIIITILIGLLSFKLISIKLLEFNYPKKDKTVITLTADNFGDFTKEWRGGDYYYLGMSKDSIICSVLYYKLDKDEQKLMVEPFGGMTSPSIPFIYFSENSNLKKYEKNNANWGEMTDDFMFRQNDIIEVFEKTKIRQKHMYAYCMFDVDLFVNIHLSKTNFTDKDSVEMRRILTSLTKSK